MGQMINVQVVVFVGADITTFSCCLRSGRVWVIPAAVAVSVRDGPADVFQMLAEANNFKIFNTASLEANVLDRVPGQCRQALARNGTVAHVEIFQRLSAPFVCDRLEKFVRNTRVRNI